MSAEQVDGVAQGRVWSGVKAQQLGLVDELGNLEEAIAVLESRNATTPRAINRVLTLLAS